MTNHATTAPPQGRTRNLSRSRGALPTDSVSLARLLHVKKATHGQDHPTTKRIARALTAAAKAGR